MLRLIKNYRFWVFLVLIFWLRGVINLDPDFGWHLSMGRLILNKGIPISDPFSYTMSAFKFVDHEWLTNTIIAKLYPAIGTIGLSFIWAVIAAMALKVSLSRAKTPGNIRMIAVLLGAGVLLRFFGVRPQVISWLFLALFLWFLGNLEKSKLILLAIPLLFLLWANLHGGFAIGIVLLPLYLGIRSYRTKKFKITDWLVFPASIGATLINPYGLDLWREVLINFFGNSLRWQIAEWFPGIMALIFCLPILGVLGVYLLYRFKNKFLSEDIAINAVFLCLAASTIRHIPLFVISVAPFLIWGVLYLKNYASKFKYGAERFNKVFKFILTVAVTVFVLDAALAFKDARSLSENVFYPKKAITFVQGDLPKGEIFSDYGWGGYLIWKLPQKKVFIDGRMSHWPHILADFTQIVLGEKDYQPVFAKYNIEMVLWPVAKDGGKIKLLTKLRENGWREVYKDKISEVLVKVK